MHRLFFFIPQNKMHYYLFLKKNTKNGDTSVKHVLWYVQKCRHLVYSDHFQAIKVVSLRFKHIWSFKHICFILTNANFYEWQFETQPNCCLLNGVTHKCYFINSHSDHFSMKTTCPKRIKPYTLRADFSPFHLISNKEWTNLSCQGLKTQ